jgi:hypothetical protein
MRVVADGTGIDVAVGKTFSDEQRRHLVDQLDGPYLVADTPVPGGHVWHLSLTNASDDRKLSDEEWADAVRTAMAALNFDDGKPDGRPPAPWVAIHHGLSAGGNDHVQVAVSLVREDGTRASIWRDRVKLSAVYAQLEERYGLSVVDGRTAGAKAGGDERGAGEGAADGRSRAGSGAPGAGGAGGGRSVAGRGRVRPQASVRWGAVPTSIRQGQPAPRRRLLRGRRRRRSWRQQQTGVVRRWAPGPGPHAAVSAGGVEDRRRPGAAWRGEGQPAEPRERVVIGPEAWEEGARRARAVTTTWPPSRWRTGRRGPVRPGTEPACRRAEAVVGHDWPRGREGQVAVATPPKETPPPRRQGPDRGDFGR